MSQPRRRQPPAKRTPTRARPSRAKREAREARARQIGRRWDLTYLAIMVITGGTVALAGPGAPVMRIFAWGGGVLLLARVVEVLSGRT